MTERIFTFEALVDLGYVNNRVTLMRWVRLGKFPAPIRIGARSVVWLKREVEAWEQSRIKNRDQKELEQSSGADQAASDQELEQSSGADQAASDQELETMLDWLARHEMRLKMLEAVIVRLDNRERLELLALIIARCRIDNGL